MCAVVGCSNRSRSNIRKVKSTNMNFFRVPKVISGQCDRTRMLSEERRRLWLARINRADLKRVSPNVRVCGAHFITGRPSRLFDLMNPDWAPSLLLGYGTKKATSNGHKKSTKRCKRKRQDDNEAAEAITAAQTCSVINPSLSPKQSEIDATEEGAEQSKGDCKPEDLASFCEVILAYENSSSDMGSTTVTIHQIPEECEEPHPPQ